MSPQLQAGVGDMFFANGLVPHCQAAVHGDLGHGHCRCTDTWRLFISAAKRFQTEDLAAVWFDKKEQKEEGGHNERNDKKKLIWADLSTVFSSAGVKGLLIVIVP